ncbi:MAG: Serine/threonine protein kinase PrkC, regulator of stationary phase [Myxococcaceae bacterium]|nr:Serine/threonine protein kinase PrkC, regulator of stationary phase [Myxococcaceae bacterium]
MRARLKPARVPSDAPPLPAGRRGAKPDSLRLVKICPRCSDLFGDDAAFCPHDGEVLEKSKDRFLGRTIAARYRLIRRLGSGGMSVVYLARHELIARLSAIKILRPELSLIAEHRERFLREARAVNRINHENIVEITDVGESDGIAYLVMEFIEGESLLVQIQRGRLPWPRAARIGMQVASALARAHQMGVIHRDLKPENILLVKKNDADTESEHVKLTDFGIAKMSGEPSLTLNEQLFGTPGYIAPEYVGGIGIDGRSDIYSLAVVVYEMVCGVLPFDGKGQSELLLKPLTSAPIPPSQRISGLPPDFESLLLRCLARNPDERPHDAFAMHDALQDIVRRYGGSGSIAPAHLSSSSSSPPPVPRDPLETIMDQKSAAPAGRETANVGRLVTHEISSRWSTALADLEAHITKARKLGGVHGHAAARAAELALVAGEMVPRVERAAKTVGELQARVDRLEAQGREFRTNLGHAIDVLVHDRSRERAHLDALRARRQALQRAIDGGAAPIPSSDTSLSSQKSTVPLPPIGSSHDPRAWEVEAIAAEEMRASKVDDDLAFQLEALQRQLDARNEGFERELVQATGQLEGSLSALRRLTSEIVRTIDDGIGILQRTG